MSWRQMTWEERKYWRADRCTGPSPWPSCPSTSASWFDRKYPGSKVGARSVQRRGRAWTLRRLEKTSTNTLTSFTSHPVTQVHCRNISRLKTTYKIWMTWRKGVTEVYAQVDRYWRAARASWGEILIRMSRAGNSIDMSCRAPFLNSRFLDLLSAERKWDSNGR